MAGQATHKAAVLTAPTSDLVVENRPTPSPGPGEVLVRNHTIGLNNIDWKRQAWDFYIPSYPTILGADVSGVVAEVGPDVSDIKVGDRVLGLVDSLASNKLDNAAYQEFSILSPSAGTVLPANISFNQGATLPTAVATAGVGLFDVLGVPKPAAGTKPLPASSSSILVWGGASVVGHTVIQLARHAGLTVLAVASEEHHPHLKSIGANALVDYHSPTAVADLVAAAKREGKELRYAFDAISTEQSLSPVIEVLAQSGASSKKIVHTTPWPQGLKVKDGVEAEFVPGQSVWTSKKDLGIWLFNECLPGWLEKGVIQPPRQQVVGKGVEDLQSAMNELKKGVHGIKYVVEV